MNIQLKNPELELFIQGKLDAGEFPTAEAIVEDALARVMIGEIELTEEDISAIKLSDAQFERGEGIDSEEVAARMRRLYRKS